jgi:hypothetical protein
MLLFLKQFEAELFIRVPFLGKVARPGRVAGAGGDGPVAF